MKSLFMGVHLLLCMVLCTTTQAGEWNEKPILCANETETFQVIKNKKEEFATSMGVSYGSILKWTYGGRFPRPQHLQKIHEFTEGKVTADDFLSQIPK